MASLNPSASVEPLSGKMHLFRGRHPLYQSNVPDWSNGLCKNVIHCQPVNGDTSFWTWCKLLRHLVANTFTKTICVIKYRQFTFSIFTVKDIYLNVSPLFISLDIIYISLYIRWIIGFCCWSISFHHCFQAHVYGKGSGESPNSNGTYFANLNGTYNFNNPCTVTTGSKL